MCSMFIVVDMFIDLLRQVYGLKCIFNDVVNHMSMILLLGELDPFLKPSFNTTMRSMSFYYLIIIYYPGSNIYSGYNSLYLP